MTIEELYQAKGNLITQIEVAQAKLKAVNDEIVKQINSVSSEAVQKHTNNGCEAVVVE